MASLWTSFRKGKRGASTEDMFKFLEIYTKYLQWHQPTLVSVPSALVEDFKAREELSRALDFTPCRDVLWFEWTDEGRREALLITRRPVDKDTKARHLVDVGFWYEHSGAAILLGVATARVDSLGQLTDKEDPRFWGVDLALSVMESRFELAQELLSIMNTRGTRFEPPLDKLPAQVVKPNRAPHSVWHTLHLPRFQAPSLTDAVIDGPVLEKREHWVRAHRKDYRQGAGMFGRIKALVWVPEHQRGNPELGTVMQSYRVDAAELKKPPTSETKADSKTKFNH